MTDVSKKDKRVGVEDEDVGTTKVAPGTAEGAPRSPYKAPRLRHLGSVKDLTWGNGGSGPDDGLQQPG